jgi:large subunit ribosomal protein L17
MRHKKRGRKLGRNPSHQRALLRNLASALILTERDKALFDSKDPTAPKAPKVPGRIVTTLQKAKEVRPLLERCISIACRALPHQEAADDLEPNADRDSPQWQAWRESDRWQEWNRTIAPVVAARRRALRLLGDKEAVQILFDKIAPRFEDRDGGYTRVLRLAKPRLGDAGTQAILELVGAHDRQRRRAPRPSFEEEETVVQDVTPPLDESEPQPEAAAEAETPPGDEQPPSEDADQQKD